MKKLSILSLFVLLFACQERQAESEAISTSVDYSSSNIYEVNIRQYTPEGTIKAFMPNMQRLKDMGIDILWLMPIQPIGVENRKGDLGSYYSIQNYTAVNPEFGTMDDIKALVQEAHKIGLKVILDWVANHSAWDNQWAKDHPDWYTHDSSGQFKVPYDWTDVIELNYDNKEMREAMLSAMKFWVNEVGMDGFRCDVAYEVPMDFWENTRVELDKIRPMFMLAEAEGPEFHHKAFDATYTWEYLHLTNKLAKGEAQVSQVHDYIHAQDSSYPPKAYRMSFVTNHDENSWAGTVFERYGQQVKLFTVMAYTLQGQPLVYSGQEAGLNKRLSFFGKDSIDWSSLPYEEFISKLLKLRHEEEALWSGKADNHAQFQSDPSSKLLVYKRVSGTSEVWVAINFDTVSHDFTLPGSEHFEEILDAEPRGNGTQHLAPNTVKVYRKKN